MAARYRADGARSSRAIRVLAGAARARARRCAECRGAVRRSGVRRRGVHRESSNRGADDGALHSSGAHMIWSLEQVETRMEIPPHSRVRLTRHPFRLCPTTMVNSAYRNSPRCKVQASKNRALGRSLADRGDRLKVLNDPWRDRLSAWENKDGGPIRANRQIGSPERRWQIMSSWSSDANLSVSAPLPPPAY